MDRATVFETVGRAFESHPGYWMRHWALVDDRRPVACLCLSAARLELNKRQV